MPMPALARSTKNRLLASTALVGVGDFMFGAVYISFLQQIPLDARHIGMVLAIATGVSLAFEAPSGAIADRYGHKRMLLTGLIAWTAGLSLLSFATGPVTATTALLLWTIGMALQSGTVWPILLSTVTEDDKQGIIRRYSRQSQTLRWAAAFLGALTVLLLGNQFDMSMILRAAAVLLLLSALCCLRLPKDATKNTEASVLGNLKSAFGWCASRRILPLTVASALSTVCMTGIVVTWQPALSDAGMPILANGAVLGGLTIAAALGSYCTKFITIAAPNAALIAIAGISLCFLGAGFADNKFWPTLTFFLLAEVFLGAMFVELGTWQQEMLPDDIRNGGYSALSTISLIAAVVVNAGIGELWERFGIGTTLWCLSAAVAVIILANIALRRLIAKPLSVSEARIQ